MNKEYSKKEYSKTEEIFNGISHGVGVVFGIVALTILLILSIQEGNVSAIAGFSIYGGCFILMYLSSTLYHSISKVKIKKILRVFDHSSIFLFIAGTYTPIAILTLQGTLRIIILVGIWTIALIGIVFKIFTFGKFDKYKTLSLAIYIGMGWFVIIPVREIINATSINFFYWILGGGLLYTLGTIFYSIKKIPYGHGIWHIFVLLASIAHFFGIALYLA